MRSLAGLCLTLTAAVALAQAPAGTAPGAPSDEPAPSEVKPAAVEPKTADQQRISPTMAGALGDTVSSKAAVLGGFDLALTIFNSTGLYGGAEGYTNSFTFWFEPSFAFGKRWLKGTWFEPMSIYARVPLEVQVTGNDPRFQSGTYSSATLLNPEVLPTLASRAPPSGAVDGTVVHPLLIGDTWLTLGQPKVARIPVVGIDVGSSFRAVVPTSAGSRNAGLITSLSLGMVLERAFGPLHLFYALRGTSYLYQTTTAQIAQNPAPISINGKQEVPLHFNSTGIANPQWGVMNGLFATVDLPAHFELSANYFLFSTKPYEVVGGCDVAGVPGSNVCTDGAAVGPVVPGAWRLEQWFLASVDYHHSFWALSLGVSTFRPMYNTDGTVAQPFATADRNNYTTVYLSFSANAEGIAQSITGRTPAEDKP